MTPAAPTLPISSASRMTPPAPVASGRGPQPHVRDAIARAAAAGGVDFDYPMGQARVESGFDPNARARTSFSTGLYQFLNQSWLGTLARHGHKAGLGWAADAIAPAGGGRWRVTDPARRDAIMALRRDPGAAAMAAGFASDNRACLQERLGRPVESVDLYLAHFLGPAGAAKFLAAHDRSPGAPAAPAFAQAAGANRAIFFDRAGQPRSFAAIRDNFARQLAVDPSLGAPAPHGARSGPGVQPADYLRLAAARPQGSDEAPTSVLAGRRMLDPADARMAYLLLAATGPGVSA